jgi:DNA-binding LacI/PurR family transcriptional regulator
MDPRGCLEFPDKVFYCNAVERRRACLWQTSLVSGSTKHDAAPKRISLKMVAERVGLSTAAVSRVLNESPAAKSIPKATQERILSAARQLNYQPNQLARSLRRGRSHTVGVLVPEVSEGYATLVLAGLEQGLLQAGYFYYLISHHHRADLIEQSQIMLAERAVDGIIAIDTALQRYRPLPTVTISCPDKHEWVTNIVLNHKRAAELAIGHLTGLGHRHIALIKGQAFSSDTEPRWQAIQHAAAKANLKLNPELMAQLEGDSPSHDPGYFAAQRLLASKAPFTAIFAFNDVSAIGAIRAVREAGLRVPQDVSVVGFDDVQSAAFQNPALTTVRQPLRTMGILAAEAIARQIASPSDHPPSRQVIVDPELVVRDSTCPPSAKKPARA